MGRSRYREPETYATVEDAALLLHTAEELKALARMAGIRPLPNRKADLARSIAQHLAGDGLERVWHSLDEIQQHAVSEVLYGPGSTYDSHRFAAKYGTEPAWGILAAHAAQSRPTPLRLILVDGVLPDDLAERLRSLVPEPEEAGVDATEDVQVPETVDASSLRVHEGQARARREVATLLRLVDAGRLRVSQKTGRPTAAALRAIDAALEGGDFYPPGESGDDEECHTHPIRAFAWPMLLQAGKLARTTGTRLELTPAGRRALTAKPEDVIRSLWDRWLTSTFLDELSRIEVIKGQKGRARRRLVALADRRDALAEALSAAPPGRWVTRRSLLRYLRAIGAGYAVAHDAWGLYIHHSEYGSFGYDDREGLLDDVYLACFLFEYAATLGVVDVAYVPPEEYPIEDGYGWFDLACMSSYDGLLGVRVTSLGAYAMGLDEEYTPSEPARGTTLRVLATGDVVAVGETVEAADGIALDAFATRTSERTWHLDRARLLEAFEAGHAPSEVLQFLQARSLDALPGGVLRLLEDLEDRVGALEDAGPARLVACRDAALADLIAGHAKTRRHCLRTGERHLAVPERSATAFRKGLRRVGYGMR